MDILLFNPNAGTIMKLGLTPASILDKLEAKGIHALIPDHMTQEEMISFIKDNKIPSSLSEEYHLENVMKVMIKIYMR
jgi:hypothetical protein